MNMTEDRDYFSRRQEEEQALANAATDPCARRVHEDMARKYAELAQAAQQNTAPVAATMSSLAA